MKMKWGALVVDGRGKIGGQVASKNRGGAYLRTKVTPVNRNSEAQIEARTRLTTTTQSWRGLTADQRNSFNNAVNDFTSKDIFGDVKIKSGFSLFVQLNNNIVRNGGTAINTAPAPVAVEPVTTLTVTMASGTPSLSIAFAPTPIPADHAMEIWATNGLSAGVSFVKSEYRLIKSVAAAQTTPYNALAAYTAVFGAVPEIGKKVFFKARLVNIVTGQVSGYIQTSVVIAS